MKSMNLIQLLISSLLIVGSVQAKEDGAPFCAITDATRNRMENAHGTLTSNAFSISVDSQENGSFRIKVNKAYRGILLYVTGARVSEHLGTFESANNFKFISTPCRAQGFTDSSSQSTLTHANDNEKSADQVFSWKPTADDLSKQGPFKVEVLVVTGGRGSPWNYLSVPITIKKSDTTSTTTLITNQPIVTTSPANTSDVLRSASTLTATITVGMNTLVESVATPCKSSSALTQMIQPTTSETRTVTPTTTESSPASSSQSAHYVLPTSPAVKKCKPKKTTMTYMTY